MFTCRYKVCVYRNVHVHGIRLYLRVSQSSAYIYIYLRTRSVEMHRTNKKNIIQRKRWKRKKEPAGHWTAMLLKRTYVYMAGTGLTTTWINSLRIIVEHEMHWRPKINGRDRESKIHNWKWVRRRSDNVEQLVVHTAHSLCFAYVWQWAMTTKQSHFIELKFTTVFVPLSRTKKNNW